MRNRAGTFGGERVPDTDGDFLDDRVDSDGDESTDGDEIAGTCPTYGTPLGGTWHTGGEETCANARIGK